MDRTRWEVREVMDGRFSREWGKKFGRGVREPGEGRWRDIMAVVSGRTVQE